MKKTTKIAAVAVIIIIVAAAAVFAVTYKPQEEVIEEVIELPAGEPPQWQVKVTGNVGFVKSKQRYFFW